MKVLKIEHVQLAMPAGEEAAARAFYGDLLGLAEVPKPANLVARGGVWFESAIIRVHLGVEAGFRPARKAHVAFLVSGLDALCEQLRSNGYELRDDEPLEGFNRTYAYDPFGNRLEFMETL